ncbi:activating signal cointegrator 1 complex subunit 2-like [Ctenocephalides felis]|uniref:activating signal cointegrator 1 complex subunit 2-like n=1 Tax=Ctenocephalides felis TaxID=7515 RepID=UPI000E6E51C2|nr:activating signal cointegrator 1 complex subunit 2-like [Ctenocephalides felis]
MTEININGSLYQNPECLPLEDLKFQVNANGVKRDVKAFSDFWVENRCHSRYPGPPKTGSAEDEQWLNSMLWFNKELEWMLNLEHFRFWSNIVYDTGCMESLISFLQEASPFYLPFKHESKQVTEAYVTAYKRVLQIFCRIITNKENEGSWIGKLFLANLLYDYSLITIPILWDLIALYGVNNVTILTRFMETVFKLQPKYKDDLKVAYLFLKEKVFTTIENQSSAFTTTSNYVGEQINLYPTSAETALVDLAWHLLDCAATMRHFFEVYPASKLICRDLKIYSSIAVLYDNSIPILFNKLIDKNNSDIVDKARVELLECYRLILNTCTEEALANPAKALIPADMFLEIISETLHVLHNQKTFVRDLLEKQPLQNDMELLRQVCCNLDPVKCDFILQSLMSSVDDSDPKKIIFQDLCSYNQSPSKDFNDYISDDEGACGGAVNNDNDTNNAIAEVSDVFPNLGSGYIKRLIDYFGTSENVISALLEDNIPKELCSLDTSEPYIPPDPLEELHNKLGNAHLNVFDGDELDIRVRDVPKEHWQSKHKRGPKNLNELLNDKSHINEIKSKYQEYNLVYDNVYDDEYDDSFEGPSKPIAEDDDSESNSRRPTELPRVLRKQVHNNSESEEDEEEDENSSSTPATKFQPFCENPEIIRARREAQRNNKYPNRDVVGKPKGHGQEKDVTINRDKKNTNKSTRANHNRRQGAAWKKSRGMMPF